MLPCFLLAGLLSVRYAPVSEGTKACKEAKAYLGNQTKPSKNQNTFVQCFHNSAARFRWIVVKQTILRLFFQVCCWCWDSSLNWFGWTWNTLEWIGFDACLYDLVSCDWVWDWVWFGLTCGRRSVRDERRSNSKRCACVNHSRKLGRPFISMQPHPTWHCTVCEEDGRPFRDVSTYHLVPASSRARRILKASCDSHPAYFLFCLDNSPSSDVSFCPFSMSPSSTKFLRIVHDQHYRQLVHFEPACKTWVISKPSPFVDFHNAFFWSVNKELPASQINLILVQVCRKQIQNQAAERPSA